MKCLMFINIYTERLKVSRIPYQKVHYAKDKRYENVYVIDKDFILRGYILNQ